LLAGSAIADITPDWDLPLAGFGMRVGPSQGVGHPLKLRATVLRQDGVEPVVIVSADILWWGAEFVGDIRRRIAGLAETAPERVLLTASHTHSGPQTPARLIPQIGTFDRRFHNLLTARVDEAVVRAFADPEPVTLTRASGTHDLALNRRYRFNPHGPVDRELTVLRLLGADGTVHTQFVHYTCHPTIHQGMAITAEYCGVAMHMLEAAIGGVSHFLQGCAGDINADVNRDGSSERGDLGVVAREGRVLADAVHALHGTPVPYLQVATSTVDLPYAFVPDDADIADPASPAGRLGDYQRLLTEGGFPIPRVVDEWFARLRDEPQRRAPSIPLELQRIDVAAGCGLLAMNGEICVDYGLHVRSVSGGALLPMGYSNGMTGYVPTQRILTEGGYEAGTSIPWFGLPAPFAPDVEPVLMGALTAMATTQGDPA
jgi:hypothetical protein